MFQVEKLDRGLWFTYDAEQRGWTNLLDTIETDEDARYIAKRLIGDAAATYDVDLGDIVFLEFYRDDSKPSWVNIENADDYFKTDNDNYFITIRYSVTADTLGGVMSNRRHASYGVAGIHGNLSCYAD